MFDVAVDTLDLKQADSWIVDSGATKHVIGNCELFNTLDQASGSNTIEAIQGRILPIEGIRIVSLFATNKIKMNNVYYILGLMSNFMSIGCMVDKGFIFIFDKHQCLVYNGPDQVIEERI